MSGTLILCGTPIGNMADASPRLEAALRSADIIYAEDTRRSSYLLQTLGLSRALRSYFAGNESARAAELAERLGAGAVVALLTDAGMPSISDPGLTAARAAHLAGARVTVVPGPSAVTAALAVSGLPSDRFVFEGFLPRKKGGREARLAELEAEARTIVLFAAPSRIVADLEDLARALGGSRPVAVTRELTKLHEEVWRGSLAMAVAEFGGRPSIKGELTVVIGPRPVVAADLNAAASAARAAIETGVAPSEAVREAAAAHQVSRRLLYQEVITQAAG
jgi:16S rRNA (cytidine1402-2'-O)-methyltransferase